ncbi:hypothetical protein BCR44DRAFT_1451473 [Catenaria anguillulae PL171]|uniref:Uncharacterized protein n=1 Tax=Catenaria anguillulae PL171 TaxID=765915 RepID=A0A1Y2H5S5_9FUNG|nr:hypothetical protein BCR44DRAFT_1451473 [Catenaria anguillulae PL171]
MMTPSPQPTDKLAKRQSRTCCVFIPLKFGAITILVLTLISIVLPFFLPTPTIYINNSFVIAADSVLGYLNGFLAGGMLFFIVSNNPLGFRALTLVNPVFLVASFAFAVYGSLVIAQEYKQRQETVPRMSMWPFIESETVGYWAATSAHFAVDAYWAYVLVVYSRVFAEEYKVKIQGRGNRRKREVV